MMEEAIIKNDLSAFFCNPKGSSKTYTATAKATPKAYETYIEP